MKKEFIKSNYNKIPLFKDVNEKDWNSWKWQLKNVIRDIPTLKKVIQIDKSEEKELENCMNKFRMAITPYYASLMDRKYKRNVIRLQAVPRVEELEGQLAEAQRGRVVAEKAQAVAEQKSQDQAEALTEAKEALAELKKESKATITEQKKEIQEIRKVTAELEKQVTTLSGEKAQIEKALALAEVKSKN